MEGVHYGRGIGTIWSLRCLATPAILWSHQTGYDSKDPHTQKESPADPWWGTDVLGQNWLVDRDKAYQSKEVGHEEHCQWNKPAQRLFSVTKGTERCQVCICVAFSSQNKGWLFRYSLLEMALASVLSRTLLGHVRGWLLAQSGKMLTAHPSKCQPRDTRFRPCDQLTSRDTAWGSPAGIKFTLFTFWTPGNTT